MRAGPPQVQEGEAEGCPRRLTLQPLPLAQVSCYFNPAVLLADAVRGKIAAGDFWALLAAELLGHFSGGLLLVGQAAGGQAEASMQPNGHRHCTPQHGMAQQGAERSLPRPARPVGPPSQGCRLPRPWAPGMQAPSFCTSYTCLT